MLSPLQLAIENVKAADDKRAAEHEADVVTVLRAQNKPQIERLRDAGSIDGPQYRAAERLLSDFHQSGFHPSVTAGYEPGISGGDDEIGTGPKYADFRDALRAVGAILSPVLCAVVIEDRSPGGWATDSGKHRNAGIHLLVAALDGLAIHYGYKSNKT